MSFNLTRTIRVGLLLSVLWSLSQTASYAGFSDLFKDNDEAEAFKSSAAQNQKSNDGTAVGVDAKSNASIKDDDDVKLTPKGVRSAVHELFHDEFSDEDVDKKVANARKTIDRGEKMMQACGNDHTKAEYKKGKVLKEIGEKQMADLKAGGKFQSDAALDPDHPAKTEKREKPDSL